MLTAKLKTFLLVKTKCILFYFVGVLCNGSISDFDSESVGSIPTTPASYATVVLWVGHRIVYPIQAGSIPVCGAKQGP